MNTPRFLNAVFFLSGLALLIMAISGPASASDNQLTFATTTPPKSNHEIAAQEFVKLWPTKQTAELPLSIMALVPCTMQNPL